VSCDVDPDTGLIRQEEAGKRVKELPGLFVDVIAVEIKERMASLRGLMWYPRST